MSKLSVTRAIGLGATALGTTAALAMSGPLAAAATPTTYLTVVGSNTTQEVMQQVVKLFNSSHTTVKATNVNAVPADPGTLAPSDANCNGGAAITYISEANPGPNQRTAPNGSGAGRAALAASVTNGDSCVSVARSSSPPSPTTDPAGTQAIAYAIDAVTWVAQSAGAAPANLSETQLQSIYDCTVTNWSQVGGKNAPIVRYYPQAGSGSASFFAGVLGFDPRTLGGMNTCSTVPVLIEENEATQISQVDAPNAIMIYSSGGWIAQANGVDPDMRNGFTLRTINGKPNAAKLVNGKYKVNTNLVKQSNVEPPTYNVGSNTAFQGVRNLFNFINTNSVDYTAANSLVGSTSKLCAGKDASVISKYGFAPLAVRSGSSCIITNN